MAGSYPDAPSRRMAWDADGTLLTYHQAGQEVRSVTDYYAATLPQGLNDENQTDPGWGGDIAGIESGSEGYFCFVFPELRDIDGFFMRASDAGDTYEWHATESSTDTTNGEDGTWSTIDGTVRYVTPKFGRYVYPDYRTDIITASVTSIRSIRFYMDVDTVGTEVTYPLAFHLYGGIAAGSTPDRLLYIDQSTGLEYTGPVDWGDIPRGAVYDEDFFVKNNSATLDAINSTLNFEALYRDSVSYYTLSTGVGWSTSLGPYATIQTSSQWPTTGSSPNYLTVRCDPPSTAQLGLHAARIVLATSSWS